LHRLQPPVALPLNLKVALGPLQAGLELLENGDRLLLEGRFWRRFSAGPTTTCAA